MASLFGSICLSDIPKEEIKKITCKDGSVKLFLNVFVGEMKEPKTFGDRTYTHYVSCAPVKEKRREGVFYNIGDLQTYDPAPVRPSYEDISNAPSASAEELPF